MPGKIDASLNEKLSRVKWGEYKLGDLFYVKTTKSIDKNKITFSRDGDYDFIAFVPEVSNSSKQFTDALQKSSVSC